MELTSSGMENGIGEPEELARASWGHSVGQVEELARAGLENGDG